MTLNVTLSGVEVCRLSLDAAQDDLGQSLRFIKATINLQLHYLSFGLISVT